MEDDYKELKNIVTASKKQRGSAGPETAEALRARRMRMSKKSDSIRLVLGRNLLGDAVYFNKIEALNADVDYRAALDHIETQKKKVWLRCEGKRWMATWSAPACYGQQ